MTDLREAINKTIDYLSEKAVEVPPDAWRQIVYKGALKADKSDLDEIKERYRDEIVVALTAYFAGGTIAGPKNALKRATIEAFGSAWDSAWGKNPLDGDALQWFNARVEQELSFIDTLFLQAKELRGTEDFDYLAWISLKADGYTATLADIFNRATLYTSKSTMLTFDGPDGRPDNICQRNNGTCVRMKGKRHKASWWIARDLIPYRGNTNFDCGAWECQHYLRDDEGKRFTI